MGLAPSSSYHKRPLDNLIETASKQKQVYMPRAITSHIKSFLEDDDTDWCERFAGGPESCFTNLDEEKRGVKCAKYCTNVCSKWLSPLVRVIQDSFNNKINIAYKDEFKYNAFLNRVALNFNTKEKENLFEIVITKEKSYERDYDFKTISIKKDQVDLYVCNRIKQLYYNPDITQLDIQIKFYFNEKVKIIRRSSSHHVVTKYPNMIKMNSLLKRDAYQWPIYLRFPYLDIPVPVFKNYIREIALK